MPHIVPMSDLRNKTKRILDFCHEGEPVFVTFNGEGELVVMTQALYEQMQAKLELYQKLEESETEYRQGKKGRSHSEVMKSLRSRLTA
ncbi:MAG: type II toxin-antitoxin system prevent-host-death family antitoxin [Deltaproteobacteria bacterium]|nr:MAG: type II toxin-antitoxin system prevent-host-death family antitoxin [Deltaproteobacteria bacterium]